MVTVTVLIFVLASSTLFNVTDNVEREDAKAGVTLSKSGEGVLGRLDFNENAEKVILRPPAGSAAGEKEMNNIGESVLVEGGNGTYRVVAIVNGTEQVIRKTDVTITGEPLIEFTGSPTTNTTDGFDINVIYRGPSTTFDQFEYIDYRSGNQIDHFNKSVPPGSSQGEVDITAKRNGTDGKIVTSNGASSGKSAIFKNQTELFSAYTGDSEESKATSGESEYTISLDGSEDDIDSIFIDRDSANFEITLSNESTGTNIRVPLNITTS